MVTTQSDLGNLRIDRNRKTARPSSSWASRWIIGGVLLFVLLGAGRFIYASLNAATEVETFRVRAASSGDGGAGAVVLNATGYIIAAHKIELAAKVVGKVAWI